MPKETTQKYATYFLNKSYPIFDTKKCCFLFGIKKNTYRVHVSVIIRCTNVASF